MDFDLKKSMLKYLKQKKLLPTLDQIHGASGKIIHHGISFDTIELMEFEPTLCDFILDDGDLGGWLLQQIIEDDLRQMYNQHLKVCVKVMLKNLPGKMNSKSLFVLHGKLIGKSKQVQFPITSRFRCENLDCHSTVENYFLDVPYPETQGADVVTKSKYIFIL